MIRKVPIFLLGGKWRYIDGHLQWEMYLIHSTPILLDMDPKTFQRIGGGVNQIQFSPYICLSMSISKSTIPPQLIDVIDIIDVTPTHWCHWCLWCHVISYWYHPICRLNPSLSSPSCIILSSHHHHIVIILSLTSSCCTLYLPSQNYAILPSYGHLIVIDVLILYIISCSTKTSHPPLQLSTPDPCNILDIL